MDEIHGTLEERRDLAMNLLNTGHLKIKVMAMIIVV